MSSPNQLFAIIPVHNRKVLTRACLESLKRQTIKGLRIIVIDDGSTDGTSEMITREFSDVTIMFGDGNLWWTGATNLGIRAILPQANDQDYVITLNNDTELPECYLTVLSKETQRNPKALIGSVALDAENRQRIVEAGVIINWRTAKYRYEHRGEEFDRLSTCDEQFCRPSVLPGRGTAIPVKAIRRIGLFDEAAFPQYAADYDFSLKARRAGFELVVPYSLFLYCRPRESGLAKSAEKVSLGGFFTSLWSIRSANSLQRRIRFAWRHAPSLWFPVFCFLDITRVVVGTLIKRTRIL